MLFWVIVKVGLKSLWANKLRSLLAMLGCIIGVGAVIAMLAIGEGTKRETLARISLMGTNMLVVRPGQWGVRGVAVGTSQKLTVGDALALTEVRHVARVSPAVGSMSQVKFFNKNVRVNVMGVTGTYLPIRDFRVDKGRSFSESEVEGHAMVAILGPATATNLFGEASLPKEPIKIGRHNFSVIGITVAKGDQGWYNPDDQVLIPYTTAMDQVFGLDYLREIYVQAEEGADLMALQQEVTDVLRKRHRIQPGALEDFNIRNQAEMIQWRMDENKRFTILLGSIAGISLLVGGIGIMNIMLVSVTERTREIGIRKAIGARRGNVLLQFLLEAVIISGLGGLLGAALGVGAARAITAFAQLPTVVQPRSIVLSMSVSVCVGVFFGWYPARRAARLNPVEALRYE